MARDFAKQFYKSAAWRQARQQALIRDHGLCRTPGCFNPAEEVHHIVELTPENITDPNVSLNIGNLISLCRECHMKEHRSHDMIDRRYMFDQNGNPVRAYTPLNKSGEQL